MASRFGGAHCDRDAKRPQSDESPAIKRSCAKGARPAEAAPGCMEPIDARPEPIGLLRAPEDLATEPIPFRAEPIRPRREPQ